VEEHGFEHLEPGGDSLLHVGFLCKSLVSQVFLRGQNKWKYLDLKLLSSHDITTRKSSNTLPPTTRQNFASFVRSKKHLAGRRFTEDANVKQAVTSWLQALDTYFFYVVILHLVALWNTCLKVKSDNVEDRCVQSATRILGI
jgi:hypothetical protein